MRTLVWSLLALVSVMVGHGTAYARPVRVSQIPNGSVFGCANCHVNPAGGGARNAFGTTIEQSFLNPPGSTGAVVWGAALAAIDSDNDGRTNGAELQDPAGAWSVGLPAPGTPSLTKLPGTFTAPASVPALPLAAELTLVVGLLVGGGWLARRVSNVSRSAG